MMWSNRFAWGAPRALSRWASVWEGVRRARGSGEEKRRGPHSRWGREFPGGDGRWARRSDRGAKWPGVHARKASTLKPHDAPLAGPPSVPPPRARCARHLHLPCHLDIEWRLDANVHVGIDQVLTLAALVARPQDHVEERQADGVPELGQRGDSGGVEVGKGALDLRPRRGRRRGLRRPRGAETGRRDQGAGRRERGRPTSLDAWVAL